MELIVKAVICEDCILQFSLSFYRIEKTGKWKSMKDQLSFPGFFRAKLFMIGSPKDTFIKLPVSPTQWSSSYNTAEPAQEALPKRLIHVFYLTLTIQLVHI